MSEGENTAIGYVEEVLPNSLFRVRLSAKADVEDEPQANGHEENDNGELILAYLAGKMRLHHIRVLVGDHVEMVLDPYGGRARIVRRLT